MAGQMSDKPKSLGARMIDSAKEARKWARGGAGGQMSVAGEYRRMSDENAKLRAALQTAEAALVMVRDTCECPWEMNVDAACDAVRAALGDKCRT